MQSQYNSLVPTIVTAVDNLRTSGLGIGVKVNQVNVIMPDGTMLVLVHNDSLVVWEETIS